MAFIVLMVHPIKGRMHVPEVKLQEYLDAGFIEVERITLEQAQKPTHIKAIENIEARAADEPGKKAPPKRGKSRSRAGKK